MEKKSKTRREVWDLIHAILGMAPTEPLDDNELAEVMEGIDVEAFARKTRAHVKWGTQLSRRMRQLGMYNLSSAIDDDLLRADSPIENVDRVLREAGSDPGDVARDGAAFVARLVSDRDREGDE